jgi:bifunctional non-homologous end joining protein LigD
LEATENVNGGKMVLKSWAVPKGPPTKPNEKRLAVSVDDHELSYINFIGTIPEGKYGAGKVSIWDSGTYELEKRTEDEWKFVLHGKKLTGSFALFHPKSFSSNQFLFIKHK